MQELKISAAAILMLMGLWGESLGGYACLSFFGFKSRRKGGCCHLYLFGYFKSGNASDE